MDPELEAKRVAYHEAGHAVLSWHFKLRVSKVEVFDDFSGFCKNDRRFTRTPFVLSLVALAGSLAEQIWCELPEDWWEPSDFERFLNLWGGQRDLPHIRDYAAALLHRHADKVHALAAFLIEHKVAHEKDLEAIFRDPSMSLVGHDRKEVP